MSVRVPEPGSISIPADPLGLNSLGQALITSFKSVEQRFVLLQSEILSLTDKPGQQAEVNKLLQKVEEIRQAYATFKQCAETVDPLLTPPNPDALGRQFILQNYQSASQECARIKKQLERLQKPVASRPTSHDAKERPDQPQLPISEIEQQARSYLNELTTLRDKINAGQIENLETLQLDEETNLLEFYCQQFPKLVDVATKEKNRIAKDRAIATFRQAAKILDEIRDWATREPEKQPKEHVSDRKQEKPKKTEKKKTSPQPAQAVAPERAKSAKVEKNHKAPKRTPASTSAPAKQNTKSQARAFLEKIHAHLQSDHDEEAMLSLAQLSSLNPKVEKSIYQHLYQIHNEKHLIKTKHAKYGRLVFIGENTSLCKPGANLKKHRMEAVQRAIAELGKK